MSKIYRSALELIGGTPLMELCNVEAHFGLKATVLAKLEYLNPAGSIKDRVALSMICDAEERGILTADSTIIEPTSGNTGIGLACAAASRGYRTIIVMPDNMSVERIRTMKAYGAELVLTPGAEGMKGAIAKAEELAEAIPGGFVAGQFVNPANPKAHYDSTGPEIWSDTEGKLDFLVAGIGTGGTITGTGKYLKEMDPGIKVIGAEPKNSPFITEGRAGSHGIQGIGAGFIPDVLDVGICDEVLTVTEEDSYEMGRLMGTKEGILVGISSGCALWTAVEVAKRPENEGKTIVVILPDTGDRYLSTPMFE